MKSRHHLTESFIDNPLITGQFVSFFVEKQKVHAAVQAQQIDSLNKLENDAKTKFLDLFND